MPRRKLRVTKLESLVRDDFAISRVRQGISKILSGRALSEKEVDQLARDILRLQRKGLVKEFSGSKQGLRELREHLRQALLDNERNKQFIDLAERKAKKLQKSRQET